MESVWAMSWPEAWVNAALVTLYPALSLQLHYACSPVSSHPQGFSFSISAYYSAFPDQISDGSKIFLGKKHLHHTIYCQSGEGSWQSLLVLSPSARLPFVRSFVRPFPFLASSFPSPVRQAKQARFLSAQMQKPVLTDNDDDDEDEVEVAGQQ